MRKFSAAVLMTAIGIGFGGSVGFENSASADGTRALPVSAFPQRDPDLLEEGKATKLSPAQKRKDLKVISYNIRYRDGDDLRELIRLFHHDPELSGAVLLALQEVDRNKKRTKNTNTVKIIAEQMGMHYAWAAPPAPNKGQEEETGVAMLSVFPL